ncbi:uncharacterized protein O3C94_015907 isoform 1-T1 [Discoglossus pictus]
MMDKVQKITEVVVKHALDIVFLMTGEHYIVMKINTKQISPTLSDPEGPKDKGLPYGREGEKRQMSEQIVRHASDIIHLLRGEVPIQYDDFAVYFSMDEWEYIEKNKDVYKDILESHLMPNYQGNDTPYEDELPASPQSDVILKQGEHDKTDALGMSVMQNKNEIINQTARDKQNPMESKVAPHGAPNQKRNTPGNDTPYEDELPASPQSDVILKQGEHDKTDALRTSVMQDENGIINQSARDKQNPMESKVAPHGAPNQKLKRNTPDNNTPYEDKPPASLQSDAMLQQMEHYKTDAMRTSIVQINGIINKTDGDKQNLMDSKMAPRGAPDQQLKENTSDNGTPYEEESPASPQSDVILLQEENYKPDALRMSKEQDKDGIINQTARDKLNQMSEEAPCGAPDQEFKKNTPEGTVVTRDQVNGDSSQSSLISDDRLLENGDSDLVNKSLELPENEIVDLTGEDEYYFIEVELHSCTICGKGFKDKESLTIHEITHTGEKVYKCGNCGKNFTNRSSLYIHRKIHNGECVCTVCQKSFDNYLSLRNHKKTHFVESSHVCKESGQRFESHSLYTHPKQVPQYSPPFVCFKCGKSYRYNEKLVAHLLTHVEAKDYVCSNCGQAFASEENLVTHQKTHTEKKLLVCSECGRGFTHKSAYNQHVRSHTRIPSVCTECGKVFSYKDNLIAHMRTHTAAVKGSIVCP